MVVLITGAGQGLGFHFAKEALARDWTVLAGCHSLSPEIMSLKEQKGNKLHVFKLDVTSEDSVISMKEGISKITDKIDILINNAAVWLCSDQPPITDIDLEKMRTTLDVNAMGPARMIKHFFPFVEKSSHKLIVNVSSESGSISCNPRSVQYAYGMSKAALNMLTHLMENFGKEKGVKTLSVHPGWLKTQMGGNSATEDPGAVAKRFLDYFTGASYKDLPSFMDSDAKPMQW